MRTLADQGATLQGRLGKLQGGGREWKHRNKDNDCGFPDGEKNSTVSAWHLDGWEAVWVNVREDCV